MKKSENGLFREAEQMTKFSARRVDGGALTNTIVSGALNVEEFDALSLNLHPSSVQRYSSTGSDLYIFLVNGEILILKNFYSSSSSQSPRLIFSSSGESFEVSVIGEHAEYSPVEFGKPPGEGLPNYMVFDELGLQVEATALKTSP